jgi:hypothetical protein
VEWHPLIQRIRERSIYMDITTLLATVAAFGVPCSSPELRDFPAEQMLWPAAYVRSIEGHNIIALREWTSSLRFYGGLTFPVPADACIG